MNIGKALTYAFKDKSWGRKLGLYLLVLIVPVVNLAGTGYIVEILRRVMKGDAKPLPDWDRFGRKFIDGLALFFVGVVYLLPVLLVALLPLGLSLGPAFFSGSRNVQGLADALQSTGTVLFAGLGCIFVVYMLAFSLIVPAITVTYAQKGGIGACFKVGGVLALISRNSGAYFTAYGVTLGVSVAASFVTGIVGAFLGWIPILGQLLVFALGLCVGVYDSVVSGHLFGQFGAKHPAKAPARKAKSPVRKAKKPAKAPARSARRPAAPARKRRAAARS